MHGVLEERGAWTIVVRERTSGRVYLLGSHPRTLMRWMLHQYPVPVRPAACLNLPFYVLMDDTGEDEQRVWSLCSDLRSPMAHLCD